MGEGEAMYIEPEGAAGGLPRPGGPSGRPAQSSLTGVPDGIGSAWTMAFRGVVAA